VESGFRVLEAGLREAYFGNMLKGNQNLFTEYIEHFFGKDGELWIVFQDAGLSLRGYIYEAVEAGDYVLYQYSWLWTKVRLSLKKLASSAIASSSAGENQKNGSNQTIDDDLGHKFIGTILQQVRDYGVILRAVSHQPALADSLHRGTARCGDCSQRHQAVQCHVPK